MSSEANADQTGDRLGETERLAVAAVAQVGAEDRNSLVGDRAVGRQFHSAVPAGRCQAESPSTMTGVAGRSGWRGETAAPPR